MAPVPRSGGRRNVQRMSRTHPELRTPPALPDGGLRVIALGGLGEIGRNMTVFEHAGKLLIVDCGVLFPEEHQPGIDVILPDFTSIRDRLDDVVAIVLTHGHEDHIGGVPYLLRERARHPAGRLEADAGVHRRQAQGAPDQAGHPPGGRGRPARRSARSTSSSSPSTTRSPTRWPSRSAPPPGLVLHTGDFKMDQFPLDRRITDLRGFARLGEEGVDLFLTDSTNAEVPGFTMSEGELVPAIEKVFRTAPRAGHRLQLRQPRAPHPAGARPGARARPQGRLRRPLDGPQHGHRPRPRLPQRARRPGRRHEGAGEAAGQPGLPDLHRLPGRADGRAVPHGQPRPRHPRSPRATPCCWPAR